MDFCRPGGLFFWTLRTLLDQKDFFKAPLRTIGHANSGNNAFFSFVQSECAKKTNRTTHKKIFVVVYKADIRVQYTIHLSLIWKERQIYYVEYCQKCIFMSSF